MFHYVYRITNLKENKHYYGCRSSKEEPKLDLGIKYFSSSKDKDFIQEQKDNKNIFKYKIIKTFDSREEAIKLEIKLHAKFNVGINESFYNKAKQTSTGYDTFGTTKSEDFKRNISEKNKGYIPSNEHRRKISEALKGKKKSPEHCLAVSLGTDNNGKNHPRFKGYYMTPLGRFDSPAALIPIISLTQMKMFCDKCDRLISRASYNNSRFLQLFYTYDEIKDRTYEDIGFWRDYI